VLIVKAVTRPDLGACAPGTDGLPWLIAEKARAILPALADNPPEEGAWNGHHRHRHNRFHNHARTRLNREAVTPPGNGAQNRLSLSLHVRRVGIESIPQGEVNHAPAGFKTSRSGHSDGCGPVVTGRWPLQVVSGRQNRDEERTG
jgi:hypothetical protein